MGYYWLLWFGIACLAGSWCLSWSDRRRQRIRAQQQLAEIEAMFPPHDQRT